MIGWLRLSDEQRRAAIEQSFIRSNIAEKAIEKDWWVTLALKALFSMPQSEHFIFKGGTSLSKGWKLIKRLSEDVDVIKRFEIISPVIHLNRACRRKRRFRRGYGCLHSPL